MYKCIQYAQDMDDNYYPMQNSTELQLSIFQNVQNRE